MLKICIPTERVNQTNRLFTCAAMYIMTEKCNWKSGAVSDAVPKCKILREFEDQTWEWTQVTLNLSHGKLKNKRKIAVRNEWQVVYIYYIFI